MTEPTPSDIPAPEAANIAERKRSPFARERRVVGTIYFVLVAAFTVQGAAVIYRDTLRGPSAPTRFPSCSAGLRTMFRGYADVFAPSDLSGEFAAPRRPSDEPGVRARLTALDETLLSLRDRCRSEGREGLEAYDALTLWRYQTEDLSRLEERVLTPDAERALRYRSPGDSIPSSPNESQP